MNLRNTILACSLSVLLAACGGSSGSSNAAPTAATVTIDGTALVGQTLTGKYTYSDADSDAEGTSTFRWLRDGVAISGAVNSTYVVTAADAGKSIVFAVTPVASAGTTTGTEVKSSGSSIPAAQAAPTATAVKITGALTVGQQLTGSYDYNDVNSDAEGTSTFKWYRDNVAIAGETSTTYTITASDQGKALTFGVTPVASAGTLVGTEVKSAASAIPAANTAPTATAVSISGTPALGETLTGSYTFNDADNDAEGTSTYSWYRNQTLLPGETSKTYVVVAADIGNEIFFGVLPTAATGVTAGNVTKSASVTGAASVLSQKCNASTDAAFVDTFVDNAVADRDFVNNIPAATAVESFSVEYLAGQFNAARAADVTLKDKLKMPTQAVWDGYSSSEKMLYLINSERCARGLMPFEGIDPRVVRTAQTWADHLAATNTFTHGTGTDSVTSRFAAAGLNNASGGNTDAVTSGENLTAYFKGTAAAPTIAEVEARSVYFWMYQDFADNNNYGHRKLLMTKGLSNTNDHGPTDSEGLFGGALKAQAGTTVSNGNTFLTSRVVGVMHVFNPNATYLPVAGDSITAAPTFIPPASDSDCISGTLEASTLTCK